MGRGGFQRILVTGASGFIGGWVAGSLVEKGYPVRALYRRQQPTDTLERIRAAGAEIQRRDLIDPEDLRRCLEGVDALIHCAALARDWGRKEEYRIQNLELTRSLAEQASRSGCRVFIFLSSLSVHGFGPHRNSTEEGPYYRYYNEYQATKKAAEQYVLGLDGPGLRVTVLRPGNVYGPGDTTTFYRLLAAQERGIRGTLGGGKRLTSPLYVEDLVQAVILALENEESGGQVFNITSGEEVTWGELLSYSAGLLGVKPWLELPLPAAWAAAYLCQWIFRLFRLKAEPPIIPYRVAHLAWNFHFDIDKARVKLGYRPQMSWREGLRRTVQGYLESKASASAPP